MYLYEPVSHLEQLVHYLFKMWVSSTSVAPRDNTYGSWPTVCLCTFYDDA